MHQLIAFNDRQRLAVDLVRQLIWWFYADLKAYQRDPCRQRRGQLRARFDRIFKRRTGFVTLDRLLARLHARKSLSSGPRSGTGGTSCSWSSTGRRSRSTPMAPRTTSAATSPSARSPAAPGSEAGRDARDACLGLLKTCHKQGLTFFDYLGARLGVPDAPLIPPLPDLVRARAAP